MSIQTINIHKTAVDDHGITIAGPDNSVTIASSVTVAPSMKARVASLVTTPRSDPVALVCADAAVPDQRRVAVKTIRRHTLRIWWGMNEVMV